MEKGCGSWFPQHQFDWQSHNLDSLQQRTNPEFVNFGANMVSTVGTSPIYANTELPEFGVGQVNENHGWFYDLPHFRQVFVPGSNSSLKMQLPINPYENYTENVIPKAGSECAQKRFLVFDQSGDQTVVYSSTFGSPIKCPTSLDPKFLSTCNFNEDDPTFKVNPNFQSGPISTDAFDDNGTDVQSEMREDTEELNALLYSDDDSVYTDDEVASTGHSPSTMTAHYEQIVGDTEDFAGTTGVLTRKRKLLDDVSANPIRCSEYEDDADSSCVNGQNPQSYDEYYSSSRSKRGKNKIRDTLSVLRSIIPGVEGKDAIVVLDEAINYLKSLKLKAETLGLVAYDLESLKGLKFRSNLNEHTRLALLHHVATWRESLEITLSLSSTISSYL